MNKKLKTVCAALIMIAMLFSLCACGNNSSPSSVTTKEPESYNADEGLDETEDNYDEPNYNDDYVSDDNPTNSDSSDMTDSVPEPTYIKPDLDIENMAALEPLTDPNAQRFVYIPASYFGVGDLYGQEAIWGYMDGDETALAIIHVEDGNITYENGTPMSHVNYLEPGDIVESTSVTITPSEPAEIYMDTGIYAEAGHDVAIYPFLDLIGMEPVELVWGYSGIHENRVTVDTNR